MGIALDLARLGLGRTSPNPAVGAVIVKEGTIIGQGFHRKAGMLHAEIEAMNNVGAPLLGDATLYITLEPCCHHGRTPPCTDAILKSGIRRVFIGMKDPDPRVSGKGIKILQKAGIQVRSGVLQKECEKLNEAYIKHRKTGRSFVILKMAMSLDGMIAYKSGKPRWISGLEARAMVHQMRDRVDAILVGIGTILKDNPRLTTRLSSGKGQDPIRIILDSSLKISSSARVLKVKSPSPTWIATTVNQIPPHPPFSKGGSRDLFDHIDFISCRKSKNGKVDLTDLLNQLGKKGVMSLLVEGGPRVAASFLKEGWVDKVSLFLSPKLLGEKGVSLHPSINLSTLDLHDVTCQRVGDDILLEGSIPHS